MQVVQVVKENAGESVALSTDYTITLIRIEYSV